jgi:UDP-N-acetyl-D-glucosamine dehydrogenase
MKPDVAIIGAGYVGMPLAKVFAAAGNNVVLRDVNGAVVEGINRGESHIGDVASGELKQLVDGGKLKATLDIEEAAGAAAILIALPTPLSSQREPDLSIVTAAVAELAPHLRKGHLVVLESTTYPGTTREVVQPILEGGGLKAGRDFHLAFSPERVDPGNGVYTTRNVPKVVGGLTPDCSQLAGALYSAAIDTVVPVNSPRVAEMVKLLENTFRAVNIGLVNEIALMCEKLGIDVWEVVDAAKTKPFGFMPFYPGPGLGGHCIPIDPFYLSWKAKQTGFEPRFIELAGAVNSAMPHAVVDTITDALNLHKRSLNGSRVLIAGLTYKRDIDDIRESPSLDVMAILHQKGARLAYADPYVPKLAARQWAGGYDLTAVPADRSSFAAADCVAILTDHRAFDYRAMIDAAPLIVDTRNAIKQRYPHVFRIGASNARCEAPVA